MPSSWLGRRLHTPKLPRQLIDGFWPASWWKNDSISGRIACANGFLVWSLENPNSLRWLSSCGSKSPNTSWESIADHTLGILFKSSVFCGNVKQDTSKGTLASKVLFHVVPLLYHPLPIFAHVYTEFILWMVQIPISYQPEEPVYQALLPDVIRLLIPLKVPDLTYPQLYVHALDSLEDNHHPQYWTISWVAPLACLKKDPGRCSNFRFGVTTGPGFSHLVMCEQLLLMWMNLSVGFGFEGLKGFLRSTNVHLKQHH